MSSGPRSSESSLESLPEASLPPIAADPALCDSDSSGYDMNETFSVTSSIFEFRYENGRTYHRYKEGAYFLPNDEAEKDRLDAIHHLYRLLLDGNLCLAPLENPRRILDVGTGTGIWAIEMADLYPEATIIGTDLSPIQPEWVPENCIFEIDDAESKWMYPPNYFDFIHSRHLAQSIKNWELYASQLFRHTKPGGYVELAEHDYTLYSDDGTYRLGTPLYRYMHLVSEAAVIAGYTDIAPAVGRLLQRAGFVDVKVTVKKLPWAPWPQDEKLKELGYWSLLGLTTAGFEAFGMALFTRYHGFSAEEAKEICALARKDVWDKRVHAYHLHYIATGRKPEQTRAAGN